MLTEYEKKRLKALLYGYKDIQYTYVVSKDIDPLENGYDLSISSDGGLLTEYTFDGGNSILTGGSEGLRSNYGFNRLTGTEYGERL